jgi:hypothetical protein
VATPSFPVQSSGPASGCEKSDGTAFFAWRRGTGSRLPRCAPRIVTFCPPALAIQRNEPGPANLPPPRWRLRAHTFPKALFRRLFLCLLLLAPSARLPCWPGPDRKDASTFFRFAPISSGTLSALAGYVLRIATFCPPRSRCPRRARSRHPPPPPPVVAPGSHLFRTRQGARSGAFFIACDCRRHGCDGLASTEFGLATPPSRRAGSTVRRASVPPPELPCA